ncbi:MAG: protein kinase [Pirellulales bacterium]
MSDESSRTVRLERLRAEQVRRWQLGQRVPLEELLREPADADLASDADALLDLLYSELLLREEAGENPTVDDFVARFPALDEPLRRQFAVHAALPSGEGWSALVQHSTTIDSHTIQQRASSLTAVTLPEVPEYELLSELGRGGMGVVYRARHRQLKRIVALKMIRDRALADETVRARFRAEAEAVARLQHPHIVQIYDCGECDGCPYLSLEFVAGGNLEAWTRSPLHSPRECAAMVETVARAVGYAHQQQIVHRDLKPANILLAPGGASDSHSGVTPNVSSTTELLDCRPKITDFGLAKQFSADVQLTHSEAILGTGAYMSPEQAWGHSRDVGPPTDVHALGVILYELLTGTTPFRDQSLIKTLDRVRFAVAEPPSRLRAEIPAALDAICLRCLQKEPADRYPTAEQLADDLRRFLHSESLADVPTRSPTARAPRSWTARLAVWSALALLVVGAAAIAVGKWWSPPATSGTAVSADSALSTPRDRPETFAFLVGVRSYQFGQQRLDLKFTESDVDELSRVFLQRGVPRRNIRLLTQWSEADNPELAPNAANIRRQLRAQLAACQPGDSVIIAITGMGGESGSAGTYCYLPADARIDDASTILTLTEFFAMIRECRAKQTLLLVDTCQTASLPDWQLAEASVPPGVAALFACSRQETSYEHPMLRHGVFSYHVLRALEGAADTNRDGQIALGELRDFARQGVQEFLQKNSPGAVQTPLLLSSLDDATPVLPVTP